MVYPKLLITILLNHYSTILLKHPASRNRRPTSNIPHPSSSTLLPSLFLRRQQFKRSCYKFSVLYLATNFSFSDRVAKSFFRMGVTMVIDFCAFNKIRFPAGSYSKVTAFFPLHLKLALSARSFHHLGFLLVCLRTDADS